MKTKNFDLSTFLKSLPNQPGVYQMYDEHENILYVGKASNLNKRVKSYFSRKNNSARIVSLVEKISRITYTVTSSENEALLLESNFIKKNKPPYNILLRDDKSYPYIVITNNQDFPRIALHRGKKQAGYHYYGPYPSVNAVRESLRLLQKLFRIRQCEDTFFKNRTRPCLQFQINRCTAPCVHYITPSAYQIAVHHAELFLSGKNGQVIAALIKKMEAASTALAFEEAAQLRDQINALRQVQEQQCVTTEGGNVDVIVATSAQLTWCISVLYIRGGRIIGNQTYFPKTPHSFSSSEVLSAFLPQYYLNKERMHHLPKEIIVNNNLTDKIMLENFLTSHHTSKIKILTRVTSYRKSWLNMALKNAELGLKQRLTGLEVYESRFNELQRVLNLDNIPEQIDCFDISHTLGEATVASCVVFNRQGPNKKAYRRLNIAGITPSDDYGAMYQALIRHYSNLKNHEEKLPDLLLIDGGKGQLTQAIKVVNELQLTGLTVIAIAKGPERKPGLETLFLVGQSNGVQLPVDNIAFHLLQQIRDEAHRFAITAHRHKRNKQRNISFLQSIPGVGHKRRQALLKWFGGLQALQNASVDEISKVKGISQQLAVVIYNYLHR